MGPLACHMPCRPAVHGIGNLLKQPYIRTRATHGLAVVTRVAQASSSLGTASLGGISTNSPVQAVTSRDTLATNKPPAAAAAPAPNSISLPAAVVAQAAGWLQTRQVLRGAAAAAATQAATPSSPHPATIRNTAVFGAGAALLCAMAATAISPDWQQDAAFFAAVLTALWGVSCWRPFQLAPQLLMVALPLPHMAGCWGAYHWSLGNLSWDILVHIWGGFTGTLLAHAAANGGLLEPAVAAQQLAGGSEPFGNTMLVQQLKASSEEEGLHADSSSMEQKQAWWAPLRRTMVVLALVCGVTTGVEVLEGSDGPSLLTDHSTAAAAPAAVDLVIPAVLPQGEGLFKPGPGDFCLQDAPCTNREDTAKDMADNAAGALLALTALQYHTLANSTTRSRP